MDQEKDYTGTVYAGLAKLLVDYCHHHCIPVSAKLEQATQLDRFSYLLWKDLLSEIQKHAAKPALGLEIAKTLQPKHLGVIAYIAMSCENLGEALHHFQSLYRLIYDGSPLRIQQSDQFITMGWTDFPAEFTTQLTHEISMALIIEFLKQYLRLEHLTLHEVHFTHARPQHMAIYEQYFQCPVKFSQPTAQLIFDPSDLAHTNQTSDQTLQEILLKQAENLLQQLPKNSSLDERLQKEIILGLQQQKFSIEYIASRLQISVRQLQRLLQKQGTTYQQRLQHIRYILAQQYLKEPQLTLQEISSRLCYSEQSAFQRSFKQWSQITPQQWRDQNRAVQ